MTLAWNCRGLRHRIQSRRSARHGSKDNGGNNPCRRVRRRAQAERGAQKSSAMNRPTAATTPSAATKLFTFGAEKARSERSSLWQRHRRHGARARTGATGGQADSWRPTTPSPCARSEATRKDRSSCLSHWNLTTSLPRSTTPLCARWPRSIRKPLRCGASSPRCASSSAHRRRAIPARAARLEPLARRAR